jgi:hypothetical protein
MLVRLEEALGCSNLAKQMVLLSPPQPAKHSPLKPINLVVGYNGSPNSQTALDLTLWIAHQTRLATSRQVTVQVVYVIITDDTCRKSPLPHSLGKGKAINLEERSDYQLAKQQRSSSAIAELPNPLSLSSPQSCQFEQFEQADHILWQARHLAEEWRGSLETHLRFGKVSDELRSVVQAEAASVLLLGCTSAQDSMVQELGRNFPCPVLGIPPVL